MPPSRKLITRTTNSGPVRQSTEDRVLPNFPTDVSPPRHAHIPSIPHDGDLVFHLISLLFTTCATFMQYLHLYRTVWWLPHSHARYALNFYLIDLHLVGFLIAIETLPFLRILFLKIRSMESKRIFFFLACTLFLSLIVLWILSFVFISLHIYTKTSTCYLLLLIYPAITYALVYYHHVPGCLLEKFRSRCFSLLPLQYLWPAQSSPPIISPLPSPLANISPTMTFPLASNNTNSSNTSLQSNSGSLDGHTNNSNQSGSQKSAFPFKNCSNDGKNVASIYLPLRHNCTNNPEEIREETELLKADFNSRLRDVLFNTLFVSFYASLVPLMFVPATVHYDGMWCFQHVVVTAVTAFLLTAVHLLPPAYVDLMHRCALHLGRWQKEEGRSAHVPYNAWSELQVFPQGALVKHVRGLFRAVGINNSAEPGNSMHTRFYHIFYQPLRLINCLFGLVIVILVFQFLLIVQSYEWYKLLSIASMIFFNVLSLYRVLRNKILLGRCYKEESPQNPSQHSHSD